MEAAVGPRGTSGVSGCRLVSSYAPPIASPEDAEARGGKMTNEGV